jgi:hypothetical protein
MRKPVGMLAGVIGISAAGAIAAVFASAPIPAAASTFTSIYNFQGGADGVTGTVPASSRAMARCTAWRRKAVRRGAPTAAAWSTR